MFRWYKLQMLTNRLLLYILDPLLRKTAKHQKLASRFLLFRRANMEAKEREEEKEEVCSRRPRLPPPPPPRLVHELGDVVFVSAATDVPPVRMGMREQDLRCQRTLHQFTGCVGEDGLVATEVWLPAAFQSPQGHSSSDTDSASDGDGSDGDVMVVVEASRWRDAHEKRNLAASSLLGRVVYGPVIVCRSAGLGAAQRRWDMFPHLLPMPRDMTARVMRKLQATERGAKQL